MLTRARGWAARHPVLVVGVVAVLVRVWSAIELPLMVSNDGAWYLSSARALATGMDVAWPTIRTPGYPVFLAGLFAVVGAGAWVVLVANLVLGALSAIGIAWIARRALSDRGNDAAMERRASRLVIAAGLLAALDPVLLTLEHFALSEALANTLCVGAIAIAIGGRRVSSAWKGAGRGAAVGGVIGALVLTRPAFQLMAVFLVAACAIGASRSWRARLACVLAACAAMAAVCGPWVAFNARRGITGLLGAREVFLWYGMAQAGTLEKEYPLPAAWRTSAERLACEPAPDQRAQSFLRSINAWNDVEAQRTLGAWARSSVAADPRAYGWAVARAAAWQLDWYPRWSVPPDEESVWTMRTLAARREDRGSNVMVDRLATNGSEELTAFRMDARPGAMAWFLRRWSRVRERGLLHAAMLGIAIAAMARCARKGRWQAVLVLMGTFVLFAAHAGHLFSSSRYGAACWIVWCLGPALWAASGRGLAPGPRPGRIEEPGPSAGARA